MENANVTDEVREIVHCDWAANINVISQGSLVHLIRLEVLSSWNILKLRRFRRLRNWPLKCTFLNKFSKVITSSMARTWGIYVEISQPFRIVRNKSRNRFTAIMRSFLFYLDLSSCWWKFFYILSEIHQILRSCCSKQRNELISLASISVPFFYKSSPYGITYTKF